MTFSFPSKKRAASWTARDAFTLVELMAVILIIGTLAAIILPALAGARERSHGVYCLNNTRQLTLAWQLYSDDHDGLLPYNMPMSASNTFRSNLNWVNNVMTWDLSTDNTNVAGITQASLGLYILGNTTIYHCPSDQAVSGVQAAAGWSQRIRSYAMNAMVGNAGITSTNGYNAGNPGYRQFFKIDQIANPTEIFLFVDENPNRIDDGSFIDHEAPVTSTATGIGASAISQNGWMDMPATYHNFSSAFSFSDGHAYMHHWTKNSTSQMPANNPSIVQLPPAPDEDTDLEWVIGHMSVED